MQLPERARAWGTLLRRTLSRLLLALVLAVAATSIIVLKSTEKTLALRAQQALDANSAFFGAGQDSYEVGDAAGSGEYGSAGGGLARSGTAPPPSPTSLADLTATNSTALALLVANIEGAMGGITSIVLVLVSAIVW